MSDKYSNTFKYECVQSIMNSTKPLNELTKQFDVNVKTLYGWVSHFKKENNLTIQEKNFQEKVVH